MTFRDYNKRRQFIAVTTYFQNTFGVLHITITQRYTFLSVEHNLIIIIIIMVYTAALPQL